MAEASGLAARSGRGWRTLSALLASSPGGIPAPLRGKLWQELCGASEPVMAHLSAEYVRLIKQRSGDEEQILKDLHRTLPEHDAFRDRAGPGQGSLFNVVKCYSLYDKEVGYCQGLANVAATLLLATGMDEEVSFAVLVRLMESAPYELKGQYSLGMTALQLRLWQFERLLQLHLPCFSAALSDVGVVPTTYASEWFLTLFAYNWPMQWVARIWDVILTYGSVAIFAVALAVCQAAENECTDAALQWSLEQAVALLRQRIPGRCRTEPAFAQQLVEATMVFLPKIQDKALTKMERAFERQQLPQTPVIQARRDQAGSLRDTEKAIRRAEETGEHLKRSIRRLRGAVDEGSTSAQQALEEWRAQVATAEREARQAEEEVAEAERLLALSGGSIARVEQELSARLPR